ncbi:MAG: hypothetical protein ACRD1B_11715 [Thermoanaerobaculia bacterium]
MRRRLRDLAKLAAIALQVGLVVVAVWQFRIESRAFLHVAILAFFGFLIHHVLPPSYRPPFFLLLSLTAIGLVFGASSGAWLVGSGLVLFGLCHLPLSFARRVTILLMVGAALAALRVEWIRTPVPTAIWPILGSMFMFRLPAYLYDTRREELPAPVTQRLSYFFLLPNVCFPLFPVVDYKTFLRTYYSGDPYSTYQVGVHWMVRGVVHLILYRVIYYHCTIAPSDVASATDLARYMVSTFLLYLRISGQFHLITGMLHLFGFDLPETHHLYYFASSFTDFWRRINVYWKDFVTKLVYYPTLFRLRRWGETTAVILSTLFVFVMTWLLHSYQWFWLRGSFPLVWTDVLFWGILGVLAAANALYEVRQRRKRLARPDSWSLRGAAGRALRTSATFVVICMLWSLWTAESVSEWTALWSFLGETKR